MEELLLLRFFLSLCTYMRDKTKYRHADTDSGKKQTCDPIQGRGLGLICKACTDPRCDKGKKNAEDQNRIIRNAPDQKM